MFSLPKITRRICLIFLIIIATIFIILNVIQFSASETNANKQLCGSVSLWNSKRADASSFSSSASSLQLLPPSSSSSSTTQRSPLLPLPKRQPIQCKRVLTWSATADSTIDQCSVRDLYQAIEKQKSCANLSSVLLSVPLLPPSPPPLSSLTFCYRPKLLRLRNNTTNTSKPVDKHLSSSSTPFPVSLSVSSHRNLIQSSSSSSSLLTPLSINRFHKFPVHISRSFSSDQSISTQHHSQQQAQFVDITDIASTVTAAAASTMSNKSEFRRLPVNVVPHHYNLELQPNLSAFTFDGRTSVKITIKNETDNIVLNSIDLSIKKATIELDANGKSLDASNITFCADQDTVTLKFAETLPVGTANLHVQFSGELNDKMKGFYRSKYLAPSGEERYAGVTQFEATDARRCFPCWDEPAIKATFDITLIVPKDRVALSNMPQLSEQLDGDLRIVKFDRTPIMPTYLVAVVVGEYDYIEDKSADGVTVRVYTPLGKKEQGRFALNVATKVLPYYNEYFNIAYPLPKMDLIAIADFSAGAMENWGLITYRETFLLVDSENTSLIRKQSIALTVGHEIAHQWFGNLVTMEWWTHLWLNEGYASFVEFLCVHHLFPEYDIWTQFVTDMYTRALELDCLKNSHPIEVPVGHPSEIDEIFDEISYNKGASVIRMLHHYIGDENFRKGMNVYLTRHQYSNTCTEDLWRALEEASNKPVQAVMSTWIKQMGFPVVTASAEQQGTKRILTVSQEKFTADGLTSDGNYFWMIPVTVSTSKAPADIAVSTILDKKTMTIEVDNVSPSEWVKINPGTVGYYRTRYTPEMIEQFLPAIKNQTMPPLDRLGLIDDLFALVQAGRAGTVEVLKLIEAYRNETNYTVWSSITNSLIKLQLLLSHTDLEDQFDRFGIDLYKPIATRLGWDPKPNESHLETLLRSLVLNRLVSFKCAETIAEAQRRFKQHVNGEVLLPADIRSACYKAVLQTGTNEAYDEMLKLYRATDLHEEKDRISRALGSIHNLEILRKVVDFAMSDEVRAQDSVFVIVAVAMNPRGRDMTWQYFKENSKKLCEQYQGGFLLARLIKYITENFATEEMAQEIEVFFKENTFLGTERTISQSVETIRLNAAWLARDLEKVRSYLQQESGAER